MEKRPRRYEISKPKPIYELPPPPPHLRGADSALPPPPPPPAPAPPKEIVPPPAPPRHQTPDPAPWSSLIPRPLSDIRELSEPSILDHAMLRHPPQPRRKASEAGSAKRSLSIKRSLSLKAATSMSAKAAKASPPNPGIQPPEGGSSSYSSTPEPASFFSIPPSSIPQRSSSFQRQGPIGHSRKPSVRTQSAPGSDRQQQFLVPNHGPSQSPVKQAGLRLDPMTSDAARRIPSRTQIRAPPPLEILEFPQHKHPRVRLELQVSAPIFVGGGSVEGVVKITVDDNEQFRGRRPLAIGGLAVDLLGIEQISNNRKATFLALGTELIDKRHPPPARMVESGTLCAEEKFWSLLPSTSALPFMISLPLDTGPPPFQSKHANIRFMLAATAVIRETGKHYRVRTSHDVHVLPTYDPEKALTSLPSPLTASDELSLSRSAASETLKVTAGLHRQVWVSGSSIFVDLHIVNKCCRPVRKLELTLERDILFYKHAAAMTLEKSAGQARIFESNEQAILTKTQLKSGTAGWHGVESHSSETRTCELEVPRGHATVRCGKWFEVRYFLNVTVSMTSSKLVSIQLPIILIHMNSLDVVPNSVAQVAAAIEEKRACRQLSRSRSRRQDASHGRQRSCSSPTATTRPLQKTSYAQGRAFAAPRLQSLERRREHEVDMEQIREVIDSSPRKYGPKLKKGAALIKVASNTSLARMAFGTRSTEMADTSDVLSYSTPPNQTAGSLKDGLEAWRGYLRHGQSSEALSRTRWPDDQNIRPHGPFSSKGSHIPPYVLGLDSTTRDVSMDARSERSATAMSLREKLDQSRFEFKAVRRKGSGGLRERSMNWWGQRRNGERAREREGWI
ncbi:hypothetical protein CB0940_01672 [Cercospora beticola]|uniref:Arrestin C-terminal-like domain-containing protein n=1 Tax=Cercospora beticola TaxID=122368 RepID=A0A2G5I8R4_CERBT|nr:hypothetical protein CB0940_01672 [Cercospora beticola]PIB01178.1 hypothetical protein CB0940_01672 [Cercospora beticola]WPA97118.1 hypothetical protein RHO25_001726 [Cercospora beticola]